MLSAPVVSEALTATVPLRLDSCWLAPPPLVAVVPTTRHRLLVASYIKLTLPPAGTVMSAPVPVVMRLAAALLPELLDRVTAIVASALTRVSCCPSLPADIPVMVWAAPEVSSR